MNLNLQKTDVTQQRSPFWVQIMFLSDSAENLTPETSSDGLLTTKILHFPDQNTGLRNFDSVFDLLGPSTCR